ncbi:hypothetical protein CR3_1497 [Cupriavidus gilardii CR3]|uniref:Uncharacterized protein n=1 Tax=Cupriavidus gilardii TaxID=82541 RepID=A0A6N1BFY8_9BURK|nr:hypothetical protein [Cupriavidus gilardii]ALD90729.1 hypothetical protein CR3_1497 [Cupriavidus gilardii CR3]QQE05821.1 hypothetical protein IC580_07850 [Cupriavidus sp. ISTL7]KAB0597865.1 hypothetical protein F7Q96_08105 [Cupriavidus gilardii]MCT9015464.1 hypothetical protein [Cupriavidus gilardii]MCT9055234.1 hypothetical protein [Cupriavidus gilardii]
MPEQLTKHPDVTLQVLKSAGARCGTGETPQILKACPAERFCQLPGGEICVFGLPDAARMTQITKADWQALTATMAGVTPTAAPGSSTAPATAPPMAASWLWIVVALVVGLILGAVLARRRRPPP